jgi:hypothetical protein
LGGVRDRVVMMGDGNVVEVLWPNVLTTLPIRPASPLTPTGQPVRHLIRCHPTAEPVGAHCGLIPLFGPAPSITTSGLQWNLSTRLLSPLAR